jgi:hypothetical protein
MSAITHTHADGTSGQRSTRRQVARFARVATHHPVTTARTCVHAAKLLPTVWRALPVWVLPLVGLAAAVKCLPVDFGADETLFAAAFVLILWARPGLLEALYREAQAGRPARCQCPRHAKKETDTGGKSHRKAEAR